MKNGMALPSLGDMQGNGEPKDLGFFEIFRSPIYYIIIPLTPGII